LKLTTPKAPGTSEKKGKDSTKASKPKSERKKSKAAASDEEVADEEVKEPEKELDPAEAKAKKEKEGKYLASMSEHLLIVCSPLPTTQAAERLFVSRSSASRKRNGDNVQFHHKARELR
jgi:hypothetical protein